DLVGKMLHAAALEALRIVDPMVEKAGDALAGALRLVDRTPLEVRLPACAEETPVAARDRGGERLDRDVAEVTLEHLERRPLEREAAAQAVLRDVAGEDLRPAGVVARDADSAQAFNASNWFHTLRNAATTRSASASSNSCRHVCNPRNVFSWSSSATGQIPAA